jgi:phosphoglucosamine mutase
MKRLFGTDGIRGKVNSPPMTPETVLRVGMAVAKALRHRRGRHMVLIGKDTRLSGYMIESALTSGICSMGMDVTLVGPLPTPGVAFLTRALRLDAGIVISASHNPFDDNGIKFFNHQGLKLPDRLQEEIERLAASPPLRRPSKGSIGRAFRLEDATGRYIEYIKSTIPRGQTLEGLKVVVDSAHGAAYKTTPVLLRELGAQVISINDRPNGLNINDGCGSLHVEGLRKAVLRHQAHVGVAHDGDADRTILVDEKGHVLDGDHVMGLWAVELKRSGQLKGDTVVATVMSNLALEHFLKEHGIRLLRTRVGDRFVLEEMLKGGYTLGGEQSGHVVFLQYNTTGDGPITAVQMLHLMKLKGLPLSELRARMPLYPQVLLNVPVRRKGELGGLRGLKELIEEAQQQVKGRVLVRASGTEQKVRVMVEGRKRKAVGKAAERIAAFIAEKLG